MCSAFELIKGQQKKWASCHRPRPSPHGYFPQVADNLFAELSQGTQEEFRAAAGYELENRNVKPGKMRALHSSAALVCNVFDYWRTADISAAGRALGITGHLRNLRFEARLPTGLRGNPPTLDLLFEASDSLAWGVESKFTEPYQPRRKKPLFAKSYFTVSPGRWSVLGLEKCQSLAERVHGGEIPFEYLDAPQLLKHALGIRRKYSEGCLLLLWYRVDAEESQVLAKDIERFADEIDDGLGFCELPYQEVFEHLASQTGASKDYVEYLRSRYFSA